MAVKIYADNSTSRIENENANEHEMIKIEQRKLLTNLKISSIPNRIEMRLYIVHLNLTDLRFISLNTNSQYNSSMQLYRKLKHA